MDKTHRICKICNRRFANGKAMGGHMRSHLAKLPIPPKLTLPSSSSSTLPPPNTIIKSPPPSPFALSCPSSEVNHMQPYRSINYEFSSEAESPRNPTGRRSKRHRKFALNSSPSDSVSSLVLPVPDETISSEDAAMYLLMLSRDKRSAKRQQNEVDCEFIDDADGSEDIDLDEDENNDDELFCVSNSKPHPKYKCETCNKVFKSHHALGGHRASHKNKQAISSSIIGMKEMGNGEINKQKMFKCPFCDKVFQSGQAFGGHKKVHSSHLSTVPDKISKTSPSTVQLFDLNLPASDFDEEVSLVENSTSFDRRNVNW